VAKTILVEIDDRVYELVLDRSVMVPIRLKTATVDQLDKLTTHLKIRGLKISRSMLLRRIIEYAVANPHIIAEALKHIQ